MILRRITQHVRDQNWTAIAIDFVIVVTGVFLGIQLGNWNEARTTEQDAIEARASLIADLNNDEDVYAVRRKFYLEVLAAGQRAEAVFASNLPNSPDAQWQFIQDVANAGSTWPFKPSGQVYDQLLNSGKLSLVGPAPVQRKLRDYYQDAGLEAGVTYKFDSAFRFSSRRLISGVLFRHLAEVCADLVGADPSEPIGQSQLYLRECPTPNQPSELAETARRLHADPEVAGDLRLNISQVGTILSFTDNLDDRANAIVAQLEAQP